MHADRTHLSQSEEQTVDNPQRSARRRIGNWVVLLTAAVVLLSSGLYYLIRSINADQHQRIADCRSDDPEKRVRGVLAFRSLGRELHYQIYVQQNGSYAEQRKTAADAVPGLYQQCLEAVPILVGLLEDECEEVRLYSIEALAAIKLNRGIAIPAIAKGTSDKSPAVRSAALFALTIIGSADSVDIKLVLRRLEDENDKVRSQAAGVLGELYANSNTARDELVKRLSDQSSEVLKSATLALSKFDELDEAASRALLLCLNHRDAAIRRLTVKALAKASKSLPCVFEKLKDVAMADIDSSVREEARLVLGIADTPKKE
jgi:vesicle coat complex subunit